MMKLALTRKRSLELPDSDYFSLFHLENKGSYIRTLFVDYSSTFNMVIPHKLTDKLSTPGLHLTIYDWILDFLTGRPQVYQDW